MGDEKSRRQRTHTRRLDGGRVAGYVHIRLGPSEQGDRGCTPDERGETPSVCGSKAKNVEHDAAAAEKRRFAVPHAWVALAIALLCCGTIAAPALAETPASPSERAFVAACGHFAPQSQCACVLELLEAQRAPGEKWERQLAGEELMGLLRTCAEQSAAAEGGWPDDLRNALLETCYRGGDVVGCACVVDALAAARLPWTVLLNMDTAQLLVWIEASCPAPMRPPG